MAKQPPKDLQEWTPQDVRKLRQQVDQNTPARVIASKLGRTTAAFYTDTSQQNISLVPTNKGRTTAQSVEPTRKGYRSVVQRLA